MRKSVDVGGCGMDCDLGHRWVIIFGNKNAVGLGMGARQKKAECCRGIQSWEEADT